MHRTAREQLRPQERHSAPPTASSAAFDGVMRPIPTELLGRPFTRDEAIASGVSSRMLEGRRFVRLHPRVWCERGHPLSPEDRIQAAALALPAAARLTGISRIQRLGLDFGPRSPVRFVVQGDLHLALPGVFLHRTRRLPPSSDDLCVTPAAAYVSYVARARTIDAIKVGDWLLHHGHMTLDELEELALSALWRDGAQEAVWLLEHLNHRARSLKESETRCVLDFAGLPPAEANVSVDVREDVVVLADLLYRAWGVVVEYEGAHHQDDRAQYLQDLGRYALLRSADIPYVQVTREKLDHRKTLVGEVFRALVDAGYDGPPPSFGSQWELLFARVSTALGPRRHPTDVEAPVARR
ncbi:hypothetical protein H5V45_12100 [Nocardioides sp. KIGAM211]|uniref:DUF559 domain-containing protein n=1 Tax=Nocardioides luti TaxID=2761101 RepID=A0A7X0VAX9_9ACTN|nr:hypothetical protein [Nocardioides luti]MBB6628061.1 hypothetical protein [Nocardioides luti]